MYELVDSEFLFEYLFQNTYKFIFRSTIGTIKNAWKYEKARMLKKNRNILSFKNQLVSGFVKGLFITFEGGEGTGKSTQSKLLYNNLLNKDIDVLLTREPGGSKEAEEIRNILIKGDINKSDPITESLLHNAARREHIKNIIKPENTFILS